MVRIPSRSERPLSLFLRLRVSVASSFQPRWCMNSFQDLDRSEAQSQRIDVESEIRAFDVAEFCLLGVATPHNPVASSLLIEMRYQPAEIETIFSSATLSAGPPALLGKAPKGSDVATKCVPRLRRDVHTRKEALKVPGTDLRNGFVLEGCAEPP